MNYPNMNINPFSGFAYAELLQTLFPDFVLACRYC